AEIVAVIWLLVFFVLRNFYFTGFELSAAAATPGKRVMGLRVASRDGGRLKAESVFARNALRELEVFLPLSLLISRAGQGVDAWMY
ncbi:MAG TPA: RDD family protein, partial [Streptomyces sp.]|nr:RDD family protein [Streptomyces sp.]